MSNIPGKLKLFISIVILILLIIPFSFLGYGIWSVINSKKVLDNKNKKVFLATGTTSIIIGSSILFVELCIIILILYLKYQYTLDLYINTNPLKKI